MRELYVLQGMNRRLVYRATEQINDVGVDRRGTSLVCLKEERSEPTAHEVG
ncbi:hypothetical protein [Polyangium jinanense]|uniref:Uncharacterized protein n=1 Tax=Polyangium jinanense TaxID=2829994 RepID=A0A9X3WYM4_9BACT|nr:hypothetical protein [Polyangium jinanense]MDC3954376.1 hypothetical protein [Polyangium jinanense]MDC3980679.1 hypothetical protein [Polyangium jinanense]